MLNEKPAAQSLTPEDQSVADEKQLKKLLESFTEVAKHKLGRTPTLDELTKMLGPEATAEDAPIAVAKDPSQITLPNAGEAPPGEPERSFLDKANEAIAPDTAVEGGDAPSEPRILNMKIYYGLSGEDGSRQPDPSKILYYESPEEGTCYDCQNQEWLIDRPDILDHLSSRPMQFNDQDIIGAIANGVMSEDDYEALDKQGMLTHTPKRLWDLTKKLTWQHEQLEKSVEDDKESISGGEVDKEYRPQGHGEEGSESSGENLIASYFAAANVSMSDMERTIEDLESEHGSDMISEIMRIAMAKAMVGSEDRIREMIREEIAGVTAGYDPEDKGQPEKLEYDQGSVDIEVESE